MMVSFLDIRVRREAVLTDAINQLTARHNDLKKPLRVTFMSAGIDEEAQVKSCSYTSAVLVPCSWYDCADGALLTCKFRACVFAMSSFCHEPKRSCMQLCPRSICPR